MNVVSLPEDVRQSQNGAHVVGLIPVYQRHLLPETFTDADHAANGKRLAWAAYDRLLAPLMDSRVEDPALFANGFRCDFVQFLHAINAACLLTLCRFVANASITFQNGRMVRNARVFTCFFAILGGLLFHVANDAV